MAPVLFIFAAMVANRAERVLTVGEGSALQSARVAIDRTLQRNAACRHPRAAATLRNDGPRPSRADHGQDGTGSGACSADDPDRRGVRVRRGRRRSLRAALAAHVKWERKLVHFPPPKPLAVGPARNVRLLGPTRGSASDLRPRRAPAPGPLCARGEQLSARQGPDRGEMPASPQGQESGSAAGAVRRRLSSTSLVTAAHR